MKNIQVIDDAINCTYDVFSISDDFFFEIFPHGQDVEFVEDFFERVGEIRALKILNKLWENRQNKKALEGIHGTLFYGLKEEKAPFYPSKREAEMVVVIPE